MEGHSKKIKQEIHLFHHDWFLVELGMHLIHFGDENLVNILLLNREINKRATILFRQHFLNFELQKEIQNLADSCKLNEIKQIFEKKGLSLNPNFKVTYHNDEEVPSLEPQLLIIRAANLKWDSVPSLYYHPRMNRYLPRNDAGDVFCWAIEHGNLKMIEKMLELAIHPNEEENERESECETYTLTDLRFSQSVEYAIYFKQDEILNRLVNSKEASILNSLSMFFRSGKEHFLNYCIQWAPSMERYETLLTCDFLATSFDDDAEPSEIAFNDLCSSIQHGSQYTFLVLKHVFRKRLTSNLGELSDSQTSNIINGLLKFKDSTINEELSCEISKVALIFAFTMRLENEFKLILNSEAWKDEDLLAVLRNDFTYAPTGNPFEMLKLLLNNFSSNFKMTANEIAMILTKFILADRLDCLQLIWYDKHFILPDREWINNVVKKYSTDNKFDNVFQFLKKTFPDLQANNN